VLVAHHAPGEVLAGELAALEVEGVAVAVVRRAAEHRDAAVVLEPAELTVVRDVAPHEVAPCPLHAGPSDQSAPVHSRLMAAFG
jgi:hypothetical protein